MMAAQLEGQSDANGAPTFGGNHLFAGPFDVPPNLDGVDATAGPPRARRW